MVGLIFDHEVDMRKYVSDEITKAVPIMKTLLEEHLDSVKDKKAKKKLEGRIEKLSISPFQYFIQALCLLLNEDYYIKDQDVSLTPYFHHGKCICQIISFFRYKQHKINFRVLETQH